MNKEFEKQYRDYITGQVPDMWSRIEAGLKDKGTAKRTGTETPAARKDAAPISIEKKQLWWKNKTVVVLVPAVAAVFLCLLAPAALLKNHDKPDGQAMNASPAALKENEMTDHIDTAGSSGAGMADNGGMSKPGMAADTGKAEEAGMEYADMEDNAFAEEEALAMEIICVRVRIEEVTETADLEYDAMCLAEVLEVVEPEKEQAVNSVSEGTKICFYIGVYTDISEGETPETGEEYEMILEPVSGEETYFAQKINFIP